RFHPGPSLVFAFLFHAEKTLLRLILSIVRRQRDGILVDRVGAIAEKCLRGAEHLSAGDPVVLLRGGCAAIAAVGGKCKLISRGGCGGRPDPDHLFARCRALVRTRPIPEAQTVEKPWPDVGSELAETIAHQRVL